MESVVPFARGKAVEDYRSPRRWRETSVINVNAKRLGLLQPAGALGRGLSQSAAAVPDLMAWIYFKRTGLAMRCELGQLAVRGVAVPRPQLCSDGDALAPNSIA